jgi:histidine kinase/DNA gyrase B/HSP90-like ATPase
VPKTNAAKSKESEKGKLRIGDDWNAIRIIALSQSNPLKAIAELVENSIDVRAKIITITRGREQGEHYLTVKDDGDGVPRDLNGLPDFKYVATHICDSIKRRLKADGAGGGLQGEFGIGLLAPSAEEEGGVPEPSGGESTQRQIFVHAGPLYSVVISPAGSTLTVSQSRRLRALPRDRSRRRVEQDLTFAWKIVEGGGTLSSTSDQEVSFEAPSSPVLVRLSVAVSQRDLRCSAEALITVTDSLDVAIGPAVVNARGLPGYTFERAGGELWRSRFDAGRNLIVVNSGHRDFVFATRSRALQLRYLVRLYVKELALKNFAGLPVEQVVERMIELSLYVEEKLKSM